MGETNVAAVKHDHEEEHHHDHQDVERIETISSTATPWGVRLAFGITGLVLLVGAFIAWQFRGALSGEVADALPWIIAAAVIVGAGAIMESITTEIWLAVIVGGCALAVTFLIVGRVSIYPSVGQSMFVVDRFSGQVEFCTPEGCKELQRGVNLSKAPPMPVPLRKTK